MKKYIFPVLFAVIIFFVLYTIDTSVATPLSLTLWILLMLGMGIFFGCMTHSLTQEENFRAGTEIKKIFTNWPNQILLGVKEALDNVIIGSTLSYFLLGLMLKKFRTSPCPTSPAEQTQELALTLLIGFTLIASSVFLKTVARLMGRRG